MFWRAIFLVLLTAGMLLVPARSLEEDSPPKSPKQSTYRLRSLTIGAAGGEMQASGFRQKGTLAQPTPIGICKASDKTLYAGFWKVWMGTATATGIDRESPVYTHRLFQNYPNPFNPTTTIEFTVAKTERVEINIYNVRGQKVRQLLGESKQPGRHQVTWNGTDDQSHPVASGVYFYRIRIGSFTEVKKMVVLK